MNKKATIIISVFVAFVLGATISFLFTPTTDDIPYTVLDDSSIESRITKSYLDNGNLIIDIYNPNCEIVMVKPATIEHHVTAGMDSVKIFNYTDQYFEVIVGNASDVYTFGSLTKTWDAKNKTVIIGTSEGEPLLTIERVSINPDLCTFEEVLNITSYVDYELNNLKDFRSRWRQYKGTNNITSVDWYIQKNQSYNVVVPEYGLIEQSQIIPNIIEYEDVTTTWGCDGCAIGNCNSSQYWNISRSTANGTESRTICFDSYEILQANPLKIKIYWNEIGVIGSHNETNYRDVWKQFSPVGKTIHAGQSYIIKVVYHKKPELGDVRIQTIPLFRGVECDELTWWNTSWSKRVQRNINNASVELTDYQLRNTTLYDSDMNTDFSDLRFTNESGILIPYWIESKTDSSTADIWLKIPSISTTTGATVWMYYNNSDVSSASSKDDVFYNAFDKDSTSGWTTAGGLTVTTSGNYLRFFENAGGTGQAYRNDLVLPTKYIMEIRFKNINIGTHDECMVSLMDGTISNRKTMALLPRGTDNTNWAYYIDPTLYIGGAYTEGTEYIFKFMCDDSNTASGSNYYLMGTNRSLLSSATGKSTAYGSPTDVDGIFIGDASTGLYIDFYVRWITFRQYTATEPTWGADGGEEDVFSITSYAPSTPLNKLEGEFQYFNVTTTLNCQCRWYINETLEQTNTSQQTDHNYTNTSLELGYYNFSAVVNTSSGMTNMQTWWVTVTDPPFIPPDPTNLTNTTGNFWIRHAWDVGVGNITDEYAVNVNGSWYNTSNAFINLSKPPRGYQNITVQAWNSSGVGTLSVGVLSDNVSLSNNPVTLTNYSLVYSIQEFDTITIDFDYTDVDGDVVTFATNAVNGTLDSATGVYSWTTTWMDRSVNHWTFNVSDGCGSVDSVVVEIEVTAYPITDLKDTFQYHASDDLSDTWDVQITTTSYADITNYPTEFPHSKSMDIHGVNSYIKVTNLNPSLSTYWAYTVRYFNCPAHITSADRIYFYDIGGYEIAWYDLTNYYKANHSSDRYEFTLTAGNMYLRINGENKGILGTCDETPAYIRFQRYGASEVFAIDDVTTSSDITGIAVSHSDAPQYIGTHTWADSELWTVDPEIDVSWALKTTPIADYTAAEYTMKVQRVLTAEYVNTTIIKSAGEAPNDTLKPCGFVNYSQPTLFGDDYGMYNFIIDKDGTTVATDYIYWMNMDISGNSYVVVDLPTYPAGAQISPSYFIDNINLVEYKYYIKTLSLFGTQMDISSDLLVDTGTVDVDTTGYDVTSYWCILVRESRADGSAVEMASDLFAITNTISAEGIVYDAESGSPLGDSKVALYQNGLWYNTTTNSTTGGYNLSDLTTDIDITVYAEHTGYTHESFTFTPLVAGIISLDIYMIPDTPSYTGTAIGGLALYAPYYQALNGATVNLWNSSWSDDTASSTTGYYLFDNIVNGSFTGNATMEGYSAATNEDIVTALGDYTQQNYLLQPQNTLTVKAKDVSNHATIMTFSVVFDEGVTYETTDGFVNITTGIGIYKVEVSADGYYVGIDYVTVVSDTEITLYLVPIDESGEGIYYPSHYVSFIVQSITGTLYANVTTSVYNAASSNGTALFSDVTGSDGVVGFELNETTLYRITFVDAAQGINEEFTLYPIDTEYIVIVSSSISFVTETPDTNLTNTTVTYTNQSWSIQNLTGDYLSTTLGISHTGQGVIAATICWATATIACGVPTLIVLGILAQLGVVSWIMVLFTGMTMLSIYILGGKIG